MSNPTMDEFAVGNSLQDDFLRDFMTAGVYDFASDIGIIQDGQIPSVAKVQGEGWGGGQQVSQGAGPSSSAVKQEEGSQANTRAQASDAGTSGSLGFGGQASRSQGGAGASASAQQQQQHGYAYPHGAVGGMGGMGAGATPAYPLRQESQKGGLPQGLGAPHGIHPHGYALPPHAMGYQPALAQNALRANSQTALQHHHHASQQQQQQLSQAHPHALGAAGGYLGGVGSQLGAHPGAMAAMGLHGMPHHAHFVQQQPGLGMSLSPPVGLGLGQQPEHGAGPGQGKGAGGGAGKEGGKKAAGKKSKREQGLLGDASLKKPSTDAFTLKRKKKGAGGGSGGGSGGGKSGNAPESGGKGGKGLRHFSMKVCAKVESKGRTTYNEVADELVQELSGGGGDQGGQNGTPDVAYDEKNIRRRVYDALNVLMAMDIISKEKKEITWRGLPTTRESNFDLLRDDQKRVNAQIEKKELYLKELVDQKRAIEALIERNKGRPKPELPATGAAGARGPEVKQEVKQEGQSQGGSKGAEEEASHQSQGVQLPFLVVQTKPDAKVDVQISEDKQFVSFDFLYNLFEIHDENYVLHNMVRANKLQVKKAEGKGS